MHKEITIGIHGKGSSTVVDLGIIADLLNEKTDIELKAILEEDGLLKLEWLKQGKIDLYYEGSNACQYLEGRRAKEIERNRGPFQIRIVASAHTGGSGFMVRGDSPIKTIYDVGPDTRIAMCDAEGAVINYALLAWLKLNVGPILPNPKDTEWNVNLVHLDSWGAYLNSVAEGEADLAAVPPENPLVKQAAEGLHGIRFLELPEKDDPEGAANFKQILPFSKIAPAPEYGAKEIWGVTTLTGGTACFWCRSDFDADLGYELTKWLDENYDLYKDKGNKLKTYTLDALRQTLDTATAPVHEGTSRYFKEKGLWREEDDYRGEYNSKLLDWYCEAWSAAIAQADSRGIPVDSKSTEWVCLWSDYKKQIRIPPIVSMTNQEIRKGLITLRNLGR